MEPQTKGPSWLINSLRWIREQALPAVAVGLTALTTALGTSIGWLDSKNSDLKHELEELKTTLEQGLNCPTCPVCEDGNDAIQTTAYDSVDPCCDDACLRLRLRLGQSGKWGDSTPGCCLRCVWGGNQDPARATTGGYRLWRGADSDSPPEWYDRGRSYSKSRRSLLSSKPGDHFSTVKGR